MVGSDAKRLRTGDIQTKRVKWSTAVRHISVEKPQCRDRFLVGDHVGGERMPTEIVRSKIDRAGRSEWWGGPRSGLVNGYLAHIGGLERHQVEDGLVFIDEYVKSVPELLEKLHKAAAEAGLEEALRPLLEAVVGYWELEDDHIPDRYGLIGLADDAYLSFHLIERFIEEYRTLANQDLFPSDLFQANQVMAKLLGPELTEKLDLAVAETFERAQLRTSLLALARWRGRLSINSPVPAAPVLPATPIIANAKLVPAPAPPADIEEEEVRNFSTREIIQGNVSVLALGAGVGLFVLWQLYFRFPMATDVRLFGWDGIKLSWLFALQNIILGSLGISTIIAAGNLKNLIANFYWPFEQLEGNELKRFYAATGTSIFSVGLLVLFAVVCATNITVKVGVFPADLDVVGYVDGSADAFFVTYPAGSDAEGPRISDEVRLGNADEVRLALRGVKAQALLLVRDKYNLTTIEALRVRRSPWRVGFMQATLTAPIPAGLSLAEQRLLQPSSTMARQARPHQTTRWTLKIRGPFRYSRRLPNRITGESSTLYGPLEDKHLYIAPADGSSCPGQAPQGSSEIQLFWDEICNHRPAFSAWVRRSSFFEIPKMGTAVIDLPLHRVEVSFVRAEIYHSDEEPPLVTKEAVRVTGIHKTVLGKPSKSEESGGTELPGSGMPTSEDGL